ncbi:type II toxin-antitoxin system RelE family toxin [Nitrospira sp. Nam74]
MGRVKSVNFSQQAISALQAADEGTAQHLKEAIRDLCLHPNLGKSLKLQPRGLKAYRVGSFRIFHRINSSAMDVLFLELRPDVYR